jgi:hypothetical protein
MTGLLPHFAVIAALDLHPALSAITPWLVITGALVLLIFRGGPRH